MSTKSTEEVLAHHLEALKKNDLDAIISDYAEDASMMSPMGVATGHEGLRGVFGAIPEGFWDGFEVTTQECVGEIAYIVWKSSMMSLGSDTLIVRDGKIVGQTVVMS